MCVPFFRVEANVERLAHAIIRCHSVRFTYSPDFLSFQDACVASDRTVYSFPLFVLFTSASFPKNPINLTVLFMWNRAGSPARRIVGFGPLGGRTQNGGTNGPRVFNLRSPLGAISEGFRESPRKGVAKV